MRPSLRAILSIAGVAMMLVPSAGGAAELSPAKDGAIEQAFRSAAIVRAVRAAAARSASAPAAVFSPAGPSGFQTYVVEKTVEQQAVDLAKQELHERAFSAEPDAHAEVPAAAAPDVQLHGTVGYSYRYTHAVDDPDRVIASSLHGRAYDWDLDFQDTRRDVAIGAQRAVRRDYTTLRLRRPDWDLGFFDQYVTLQPLRGQAEEIFGTKLEHTWSPRHATRFAAGTTEDAVSTTGGTGRAKYLGHLYAGQHAASPTDWLKLQGGLFYFERDADVPEQSGLSDIARANWLPMGGAELALPYHLTLSGHAASANYEPDDDPDHTVHDWNWRTGLDWSQERGRSSLAYEFVGDRYASTGDPAAYQDYQGATWSGVYDLTDEWMVSGTATHYRNNVNEDDGRVTSRNQALSFTTRHQLPREQSLALTLSDFLTDPDGPDPGSSQRTALYRADYFRPFVFTSRLLTSYEFGRTDSRTSSDSTSHRVNASLFTSYAKGSSLSISQQAARTLFESQPNTLTLTTSVNTDHRLAQWLTAYANGAYNRSTTAGSESDNVLSASTGLRAQLGEYRSATLEYAINSYNLRTEEGRWPRGWSIFAFVSQGFDLVSAPTFGRIESYVFEDANANGQFDAGEALVNDATLSISGGRRARTDRGGRATFIKVAPGRHEVRLDLGGLDPRWTAVQPAQRLQVAKRRTATAVFPLTPTGAIRGRVFLDANRDLTFQTTEEPVDNVAIILEPGEQFRRTDEEGQFAFDHVLPGRYTLRLHHDDVPTGYVPEMGERVELELAPGQTVDETNFPLKLGDAEIKRF